MSMDQVKPKAVASGIPVYCTFDELVSIESLVPNPRNPNKHSEKQIELLAKIIKHQGWRLPITVSNRSGFIVRGHGRLLAAQRLGVGQIPVNYQDYATEADEWADLIADNRIAELAEMDRDSLVALLKEVSNSSLDLEITGFVEQDLDALVSQVSELDQPLESEDDEPSSGGEDAEDERMVQCPWCGHEFLLEES